MNTKNNLTLLLLTHNNSKDLQTNFSWINDSPVNEVVIVDDNSTDDTFSLTKSLFKKIKVKAFSRPLNGDFSSQRNFAISHASNSWVLWLDPDETPTTDLINFLNNFDTTKFNYSFVRNDSFLGQELKHGENRQNKFVRLFNKNYGEFYGKVHEIWKSSKPTTNTALVINHFPHPDLKTFFQKINFYSDLRAQELFESHKTADIYDVVFYTKGKFLQNYIFKLGFLDGTPGIIMALGMSFHSFLVRAKLWHLLRSR